MVQERCLVDGILTLLVSKFDNGYVDQVMSEVQKLQLNNTSQKNKNLVERQIVELTKNIARAKQNLSRLDADLIDGVVADIRAWQTQLDKLTEEKKTCGRQVENTKGDIEKLRAIMKGMRTTFYDADRESQRVLLRQHIAWVKVHRGKNRNEITGADVMLRTDNSECTPGDTSQVIRKKEAWNLAFTVIPGVVVSR